MSQFINWTYSIAMLRVVTAALLLFGVQTQTNGQGAGKRTPAPPPPSTATESPSKAKTPAVRSTPRANREMVERERLQREAEANLAREREDRLRAQRETSRERTAREAAEAKRKELEAVLPNARIESVSVDSAIVKDGRLGLQVRVKFDVSNLKDFQSGLGAAFYDANGQQLRDTNGAYNTADGGVSTGDSFKPPYVNSTYTDFPLFMPYDELHLAQGGRQLKLFAYLWVGDRVLAKSSWVDFSVTPGQLLESKLVPLQPRGQIESLQVQHDIDYVGKRGMMIRFKLTLYNLRNVECKAVAFFYSANEQPLAKASGPYATDKSTLMTEVNFTPHLVNALYSDIVLFMPYDEIPLGSGRYDLKFFVGIFGKDIGYFVKSDWVAFTMTRK